MNKKAWRQKILTLQHEMSEKDRLYLSQRILTKLLEYKHWQQAKSVALYYSIGKEVDTLQLLRQGWGEGKAMYLPKCFPKVRRMKFFKVDREEQLEVVYMDIPEPKPEECSELIETELDLMIVPGLVYDREGYRIGYGGGYYDRYLAQAPSSFEKISIAFSFQVVQDQRLPREAFDIPVDTIMTDEEIILCHQGSVSNG